MVEERNVGSPGTKAESGAESRAGSEAASEPKLTRRRLEPRVDEGADEPLIVVEIIDIDGICGVY